LSNKKKYIVFVKEIHQIQIEVDAHDEGEALEKAMNGDGLWLDNTMEFVDSLGSDHWDIQSPDLSMYYGDLL
jgi:hypothetical protein